MQLILAAEAFRLFTASSQNIFNLLIPHPIHRIIPLKESHNMLYQYLAGYAKNPCFRRHLVENRRRFVEDDRGVPAEFWHSPLWRKSA